MEIKLKDLTKEWALWTRPVAFEVRKNFEVDFLAWNDVLILDFEGIWTVTQSSIDELIWVFIKNEGKEIISRLSFRNCNEKQIRIIRFVIIDRLNKLDSQKTPKT